MSEMSVVSLNVNGHRDHRKRRLLFDYLKYEKFDVIFLPETHIATVKDCVKWNNESGLKGYWGLGLSNSCGVGILLRDIDRFISTVLCVKQIYRRMKLKN